MYLKKEILGMGVSETPIPKMDVLSCLKMESSMGNSFKILEEHSKSKVCFGNIIDNHWIINSRCWKNKSKHDYIHGSWNAVLILII